MSTDLAEPQFPTHNLFIPKMKVIIEIGRLRLKVSLEHFHKPVFVRGYCKVINGKLVYVRPHYRKR